MGDEAFDKLERGVVATEKQAAETTKRNRRLQREIWTMRVVLLVILLCGLAAVLFDITGRNRADEQRTRLIDITEQLRTDVDNGTESLRIIQGATSPEAQARQAKVLQDFRDQLAKTEANQAKICKALPGCSL